MEIAFFNEAFHIAKTRNITSFLASLKNSAREVLPDFAGKWLESPAFPRQKKRSNRESHAHYPSNPVIFYPGGVLKKAGDIADGILFAIYTS